MRGVLVPDLCHDPALGYIEADAFDLTQEYFARLLEKPVLAAADQSRGRFRCFLRADCRFFLAGRRDHDWAKKRGGGYSSLSIDARDAEGRFAVEPADDMTPELLFDRAWALTLLGRTLDRLSSTTSPPAAARSSRGSRGR